MIRHEKDFRSINLSNNDSKQEQIRIHKEKLSLRKIISQRDYRVHKAAIRVCEKRSLTQTDTKEYIHLF